jgi:TDG/mug DNA glycosylase family protein
VRVLFVGINPGLRSAQTGHHFAGYSNRFWKLLFDSQLVSEPLTYKDDVRLFEWKLGLTNIISRPSAGIAVLSPQEYVAGRRRLQRLLERFRPRVIALLGVTIYRNLFPNGARQPVRLGLQRQRLAGIPLYVLPNPSGRNAHYSYREMLRLFRPLKTGLRGRQG